MPGWSRGVIWSLISRKNARFIFGDYCNSCANEIAAPNRSLGAVPPRGVFHGSPCGCKLAHEVLAVIGMTGLSSPVNGRDSRHLDRRQPLLHANFYLWRVQPHGTAGSARRSRMGGGNTLLRVQDNRQPPATSADAGIHTAVRCLRHPPRVALIWPPRVTAQTLSWRLHAGGKTLHARVAAVLAALRLRSISCVLAAAASELAWPRRHWHGTHTHQR